MCAAWSFHWGLNLVLRSLVFSSTQKTPSVDVDLVLAGDPDWINLLVIFLFSTYFFPFLFLWEDK